MAIAKPASESLPMKNTQILFDILNENLTNLLDLNRLLQAERKLLEERKRTELTQILTEKSKRIEKIAITEQHLEKLLVKLVPFVRPEKTIRNRRLQALQSSSATTLIDPSLIESLIEKSPPSMVKNLRNTWSQLKSTLKECQTQNAINGQIINKSKANVDAILSLFRGKPATTEIYHADGQTEQSNEQRFLAKA